MLSNGFAPGWPGDPPAKRVAWLLVGLLHLLAGWVLTRPEADPGSHAEPPMTLIYIDLSPPLPALTPAPAAPAEPRDRARARPAGRVSAPSEAMRAADSVATRPEPAAARALASDDWSMPAAPRDDGIRFERKSPMTSINPIRRPPPERFRMRQRAASLSDYVRALSQILLWPGGYTDDPCDGLAEAAQVLAGQATTKGRQALLEDVVRQQNQYCSP